MYSSKATEMMIRTLSNNSYSSSIDMIAMIVKEESHRCRHDRGGGTTKSMSCNIHSLPLPTKLENRRTATKPKMVFQIQ